MLPPTWYPGSKDRLPFDLVLIVNKLDSLPKTVSHGYIESWVSPRLLVCAAYLRMQTVHVVSASPVDWLIDAGVARILSSNISES